MGSAHEEQWSKLAKTEFQLAALVGLVINETAALETTVAVIAANLMGAPSSCEADRQAFLARSEAIRKKPMAQKVETLKLVWPHRWTRIDPLASALTRAAQHRNDLAHSYSLVDVRSMLDTGRDWREVDLKDHWYRQSMRSLDVRTLVDLDQIDRVLDEIKTLHQSIIGLHFLVHATHIPLDVTWHLANPPGSFTRRD